MNCQCADVSTQDTESSESPTYETNTKTLSNHYVVNYGEIENYQKLNTLINYKYYILTNNKYYLTFIKDDVSSNHIEENIITNYYFTNKLITNVLASYSNDYFQTIGNNFYKYLSNFNTKVIRDDISIGYSNVFTNLISITNVITNFDLTSDNSYPHGITTYNSKLYIADYSVRKVYVYTTNGEYENSNFSLMNILFPRGITSYNNKFYVTDFFDSKIYIYSDSGVYETNFHLTRDNGSPHGITEYNNRFYVTDGDEKFYIYGDSGVYETSFHLTSDNDRGYHGITEYNNRFYVTESDSINGEYKVYIYGTNGIYDSSFDLMSDNSDPYAITEYNNRFYVTDDSDNKVYIYPFD